MTKAPKASKAVKPSSPRVALVCTSCVTTMIEGSFADNRARVKVGALWDLMQADFGASVRLPEDMTPVADRALCACCHERGTVVYECPVSRPVGRPRKVEPVKGESVKVESGKLKGGPRKVEPVKVESGKRLPWSERTFRVLSNPSATPKMHETRESAIAHGKRHVEAGRAPLVQELIDGEWRDIEGWESSKVPSKLAYRW